MTAFSRSAQRRLLAEAQRQGDTDLFFYLSYSGNGRAGPAAVSGKVPVVPVGTDPDAASQWAHLMLELAQWLTPGARLATELTTRDLLDELLPGKWQEWRPIDCVCEFCGGIDCPGDVCLPPGYSRIEGAR